MIEKRIVKELTYTLIEVAKDRIDEVREELEYVTKVLTLPRVWRLVNHPRLDILEKRRFIGEIIPQVSGATLTFLNILLEREGLGYLPKISSLYEKLVDRIKNRVKIEVTSAITLGEEEESGIKEALRKITGREVRMEVKEDPRILGGIIVRFEDRVIDGSVRRTLEMLKEELIR